MPVPGALPPHLPISVVYAEIGRGDDSPVGLAPAGAVRAKPTPFADPEENPQRVESKSSAHDEHGPRPDARRSPASEPPQAPDLKRDRRTGQHSREMVRLPGRMIEFVKFTWLHTSPYMREVMTFDYCQALREVDNTVFQPPRSGTWLGGPCDLDIWKTLLTPSPTPAQTIPLSLLGCHPPARPRPL